MAISNVSQGVYSAYSYQWKQQQLQGVTSNSTGTGSSKTQGPSYNGASTVASMVELAKYAMNAMGVGKNERVTFSQIQVYKEQLERQFNDNLKKQMEGLGVAKDANFSVSVDAEGKISVDSNHPDKAKIQKYFDSNPDLGKKIRDDLSKAGLSDGTPIRFSVDANGGMSLISAQQNSLQGYFDKNAAFGSDLLKGLEEAKIDLKQAFSFSTDEHGTLNVDSSHPNAVELQKYLDEHPEVATDLKKILEKQGIAEGAKCTLTMDLKGNIAAQVDSDVEQGTKIMDYLKSNSVGSKFKKGLESVGVDPNIDFRLSLDEYGKVKVVSSHPDAAKIQKLFDDNPELAKQYQQIDALAGLDSARKSMQIDPTAMRKRIEIESMAAWWGESGSSSIGNFTGGSLALLQGVNTQV